MIFSDVYNEKGVWQQTPFYHFFIDRIGRGATPLFIILSEENDTICL